MEDQRAAMEQATHGTGVEVTRTADNQLKLIVPNDIAFDPAAPRSSRGLRAVLDQLRQGCWRDDRSAR